MNVEEGDSDFCPRCGAPLERELRASNGGEPLDEEVLFERIPNGQSFHGDFHGSKTDGGYPMGGNLPVTRAVIYLHDEDAEPHAEYEPNPMVAGQIENVTESSGGEVTQQGIERMNEIAERRSTQQRANNL